MSRYEIHRSITMDRGDLMNSHPARKKCRLGCINSYYLKKVVRLHFGLMSGLTIVDYLFFQNV